MMQVIPVPPHTGTGHTGKENEMSIIRYEQEQGKLHREVEGRGIEILSLFATIYEDLREEFKDAGGLKEFDAVVDEIIRKTREGV